MIQVLENPSVSSAGQSRYDREKEIRLVAAPASATPTDMLIGSLPHPRLRLRAPIRVEIQREAGEVGVWSPDLEELGTGSHLTAALEDFQRSIVELYLTLSADHDRLGPGMTAVWRQLQNLVDVRP